MSTWSDGVVESWRVGSIPIKATLQYSNIPIPRLRLCLSLCALLVALSSSAMAQQSTKVPRIGYLGGNSSNVRSEAFRQGLRELHYVEGKNIVIEWRHHGGKLDRLPALAAELVRLKVDIIITVGAPAVRAAKEATVTIPIVMMNVGDAVGGGFVASLARPGGNITGLSGLVPELSGKRLELLKEVVPRLSRVAIFGTSTSPDNAQALKEIELAAKAFGVKLQYLDILSPKDFETAFRAASKERAEAALYLVAGGVAAGRQTEFAKLAVKNRLPVIYGGRGIVEAGGAYVLRREPKRLGPARRILRGPNSEGSQACRSSCGATNEI